MPFSAAVARKLGYYVYIYSHPETGTVFYVGKGKGNRAFSHLADTRESAKVAYIQELRDKGLEPRVEILVHGLKDEQTALRIESSIIDLLGVDALANVQSGYHSATHGRMTPEQLAARYEMREVTVVDPAILIRINQAFRHTMTPMELYDYTRGHWRVNRDKAKRAKYALSVYAGVVQEVYQIREWFPAGQTYSVREGNEKIAREAGDRVDGRFEFVGNLAPAEVREKYRYGSVASYFKRGSANPVRYVNLGEDDT